MILLDLLPNFNGMPEAISETINASIFVAKRVTPLLICLQLGIGLIQFYISDTTQTQNLWTPLFVRLLIMIVIFNYAEVFGMLNTGLDAITGLPQEYYSEHNQGNFNSNLLLNLADKSADKLVVEQDVTGPKVDGNADGQPQTETEKILVQVLNPTGWLVKELINGLQDLLTWILAILIRGLAFVLSNIVFALGPLALMTTCIPILGQKIFQTWITYFIHIKFWTLTIFIIDHISDSLNAGLISTLTGFAGLGSGVDASASIVLNLIIIILYLMVPKLTSLYMPSSFNGMMSSLTSAATGVVAGGAAAMTGGGSLLAQGGVAMGSSGMASFGSGMMSAGTSLTNIQQTMTQAFQGGMVNNNPLGKQMSSHDTNQS